MNEHSRWVLQGCSGAERPEKTLMQRWVGRRRFRLVRGRGVDPRGRKPVCCDGHSEAPGVGCGARCACCRAPRVNAQEACGAGAQAQVCGHTA